MAKVFFVRRDHVPAFFVAVALSIIPLGENPKAQEAATNSAELEENFSSWSASFSSQVQYYSWDSTSAYPHIGGNAPESEGSQVYVPLGLQISGQPSDVVGLQFMVRSGYMRSSQKSGGVTYRSRGFTDTSLSATASYAGWSVLQPYISLSTNLPTGESSKAGSLSNLDSDVVDVPTSGEGSNGGISIGANIPINESLIASLGAGYTHRGPYTTASIGRIDPGDTWTVNAGLGYQGEYLTAQAQLSYSSESETTLAGLPYYQSGGSLAATLGLAYAWDEAIASRANFSFSRISRNKVLSAGAIIPVLVKETFNSNSNVFQIDFDTTYSGENFSIGPTVGFLYRNHNAWSPSDLEFLSAKSRWSVGITMQYALTETVSLNGNVSRLWLKQDATPDKLLLGPGSGVPKINTDAWLATFGLSLQF